MRTRWPHYRRNWGWPRGRPDVASGWPTTLADHPELAARVDRGEVDARRAEELVRLDNFERRRAAAAPARSTRLGRGIEVRCGDFREVLADVPDHSIDAIVTDPPYDRAGVPLFEDFARFALRVLRPGRLAAIYAGNMELDEEMRLFERGGLTYRLARRCLPPGPPHDHSEAHGLGSPPKRAALLGRSLSPPPLVARHLRHGESAGAVPRADRCTRGSKRWSRSGTGWRRSPNPGEIVLDPFVGSGSTAMACVAERRRFLGCDIDPGCVATTIERLKEAEGSKVTTTKREQAMTPHVVHLRGWPGLEDWLPPARPAPYAERLGDRIGLVVHAASWSGAMPERFGLGAALVVLGSSVYGGGAHRPRRPGGGRSGSTQRHRGVGTKPPGRHGARPSAVVSRHALGVLRSLREGGGSAVGVRPSCLYRHRAMRRCRPGAVLRPRGRARRGTARSQYRLLGDLASRVGQSSDKRDTSVAGRPIAPLFG